MRLLPVLLIVCATLALAGCPKKPTTVPESSGSTAEGSGANAGQGEGQVGQGRDLPGASGSVNGGPAGAATIIYFDYDRSDIRPEYASLINTHAKFLAASSAIKIRVEGHTDERGSREYNIALAERRAQAVRSALMLQGAGDAQLTTVSYGEERPAVAGSDESAYEKNRRVELVYGR